MPDAATMPTPSPATSSLPLAVPCAGCGYNLRGLGSEGVCPECATPIARSRELIGTWLARGVAVPLLMTLRHTRRTLVACIIAYFSGGLFSIGVLSNLATWASVGKVLVLLVAAGCLIWHATSAFALLAAMPVREGDARWRTCVRVGAPLMAGMLALIALAQLRTLVPMLPPMTTDAQLWFRRATMLGFILGLGLDALGLQALLRPLAISIALPKVADDLRTGTKWALFVCIMVGVMGVLYALQLRRSALGELASFGLFLGPLVSGIQVLSRSGKVAEQLSAYLHDPKAARPLVHRA